MSKRTIYPYFLAIGLVEVYEHGATRPTLTLKASSYISFQEESARLLVRDAKYKLELIGTPKDRIDSLFFDLNGISDLHALDCKGVRRIFGEPVEAFLDYPDLKKRDQLIRQRRVIPYDHSDTLEMYGPTPVAAPTTRTGEVAA